MSGLLVVVLRLPEVRLQRGGQQFLSVGYPTGEGTRLVDGDSAAVSGHDEALGGLLGLGGCAL